MIILKNGDQLRNLEEQVLKNKEDIARHYEIDRALANLGIKVIGQLNSAEDLPDPLSYSGEFGDAYAVGDKTEVDMGNATYTYYVFSRPDINAGETEPHWLDVGRISIVGPQGPQGIQGPQGPVGQSTKWYTGQYTPTTANEGDLYLNNNGQVFQYSNGEWKSIVIIKGPQGIQGIQGPIGPQGVQGPAGPKGDTGDVGGFINIAGKLTNESQLPTPSSLGNLTVAYLVNDDLYIQIGSTSAEATWNNMGPLNVATLVTVGGQYQNTWDADTKLDKIILTDSQIAHGEFGVYTTGKDGKQNWTRVSKVAGGADIAMRVGGGQLEVNTPTQNQHATNKQYVDTKLATKLDKYTADDFTRVYGVNSTTSDGAQTTFIASQDSLDDSVAIRVTGGQLNVADPYNAGHAATKGYVDTAVANKSLYHHVVRFTENSKSTVLCFNSDVSRFSTLSEVWTWFKNTYGSASLAKYIPLLPGTSIQGSITVLISAYMSSATQLVLYGLGGTTTISTTPATVSLLASTASGFSDQVSQIL